jgi:hypothetical protein
MEKLITEYYLETIFDGKKSFYKKAEVKTFENRKDLYSYDTLAATVYFANAENEAKVEIHNMESVTTIRHVTEFLKQEMGNSIPSYDKEYLVRNYFKGNWDWVHSPSKTRYYGDILEERIRREEKRKAKGKRSSRS